MVPLEESTFSTEEPLGDENETEQIDLEGNIDVFAEKVGLPREECKKEVLFMPHLV